MAQKLDLPDDELIFKYTNDRKSIETISREYNCSRCAISNHLKANAVVFRPKGGTQLKGKQKSLDTRAKMRAFKIKNPQLWVKNAMDRPEVREKWERITKDPAYRAKIGRKGEKNPHWRGGISFEPYCPKFNATLKESIRNKYNRICQKCYEPENGRKLDVHHINFDKQSGCFGKPWNLIPLHQKCHAWTTNNRFEAFHLLMNHWAMNKNINFGGGEPDIYAFCLGGT
jgi:hypothetical protein